MAQRISASFALGFCLAVGAVCLPVSAAHAGFQWISPSEQEATASVTVPMQSAAAPVTATSLSPVIIQGSNAPSDTYYSSSLSAPASASVSSSGVSATASTSGTLVPPPSAVATQATAVPDPVIYTDTNLPPDAAFSAPSDQPLSLATPAGEATVSLSPAAPAVAAPAANVAPEHTLRLPAAASTDGAKNLQGFASKIPLAVALRQVLPSDYGFSVDRDVALSTPVSWRGGRPWREVLRDMLSGAGLALTEQGQMIRIARSGAAPAEDLAAASSSSFGAAPAAQSLSLPSTSVGQAPVPADGFAVSDITTTETWTANRGEMLREVLEKWAKRSHVEFNWKSEYDYPIQASVTVSGGFEEAVRKLLSGFQEAEPQPIAHLYSNKAVGQAVLVVEARGNNYSE